MFGCLRFNDFMKKIFTFFLLSLFIIVFSQKQLTEKQIDSVQSTIFTTNAQNADKIEVITTELFLRSKELNYKKGQIEALLRRAAFRVNSRAFDFVEQDLNEAIQIANETGDYYSVARAKTIEASMYNTLKLYDKTKQILDDNFSIINKIQDVNKRRLMETFFYGRYINLYGNQDLDEKVRYYADKRLKTALLLPESEKEKPLIIISTARLFCIHYLELKDVKKVEYYLNLQEKYINQTDNLFDLTFYHKTKAKFIYNYRKSDKDYLNEALSHYKLAEKYGVESKNPMLLESIYPEMAKIYEDIKSAEEEAKYINKYSKLKDSITPKENKAIEKLVFNHQPNEKQSADNAERSKFNYLYFLIVLAVLFIIGFVGFYVHKKRSVINTQFPSENSLLSSKITENPQQEKVFEELRKLALENNVAFLPFLIEAYPDFKKNLLSINPNLLSSDIEFCGFLKILLTNEQILETKKISKRALDSKKYRIRKKLNIPSHEDLYEWMSKI